MRVFAIIKSLLQINMGGLQSVLGRSRRLREYLSDSLRPSRAVETGHSALQ